MKQDVEIKRDEISNNAQVYCNTVPGKGAVCLYTMGRSFYLVHNNNTFYLLGPFTALRVSLPKRKTNLHIKDI